MKVLDVLKMFFGPAGHILVEAGKRVWEIVKTSSPVKVITAGISVFTTGALALLTVKKAHRMFKRKETSYSPFELAHTEKINKASKEQTESYNDMKKEAIANINKEQKIKSSDSNEKYVERIIRNEIQDPIKADSPEVQEMIDKAMMGINDVRAILANDIPVIHKKTNKKKKKGYDTIPGYTPLPNPLFVPVIQKKKKKHKNKEMLSGYTIGNPEYNQFIANFYRANGFGY